VGAYWLQPWLINGGTYTSGNVRVDVDNGVGVQIGSRTAQSHDAEEWPGFEVRLIDRLMCAPHAEPIGAAIGACISFITLLVYGGTTGLDLRQLLHTVRNRAAILGLFAVIFAIGGWWTVHTWRQLWRRGRSPRERLIYDYGVRGFGFSTAVSLFFIITWLGWMNDSGTLFGSLMTGGAIAALFFGVPVSLHLGYFWGRALAAVAGAEGDPRVEVGEPPHLT